MDLAVDLELIALACDRAAEVTRTTKSRAGLQSVGKLREIDSRGDVHLITKRAPVVHDAVHLRFRNRRFQHQFLNLCSLLIDTRPRLDIDVVDGPIVVSKS